MSREIKFRVWVKDEKKYIPNFVEDNDAGDGYGPLEYDVYYVAPETGAIVKHHSYREFGDWMYSVEATNASREVEIEQYTGLKDKNGKEIYEGDILKFIKDPVMARVMWNTPSAEFRIKWLDCKVSDSLSWHLHDHGGAEVIGNIHENQELLEGEE